MVNGDGAIVIRIALGHDLVNTPNNLEYATSQEGKRIDGILQLLAFQLVVLVHVQMSSSTADDVGTRRTGRILWLSFDGFFIGSCRWRVGVRTSFLSTVALFSRLDSFCGDGLWSCLISDRKWLMLLGK